MKLPDIDPCWETVYLLRRLYNIRQAYLATMKFLKSDKWLRAAEERGDFWGTLDADFYQTYPEIHPRMQWLKSQWSTLFARFLRQIA